MRLAHIADLHIGFRSFERVTADGTNVREHDVSRTFAALVDQLIAQRPDVIIAGGDILHSPRPSNRAILTAFDGFARLMRELPGVICVAALGNHDLSPSRDHASILDFLSTFGVYVASRSAQRFDFPDRDLSILAAPDAPGVGRPAFTANARAKYRVAVVHGEMHGQLPAGVTIDRPGVEISLEELHASDWTYIGMGHWHVHQQIAPNGWYAGSMDRTSTDPWGEMRAEVKLGVPGKGFVMHDLETGAHDFHPLPVSRRYLDLPALDAADLAPKEIDARLAETIESADIADAVVRLVVHNVTRETARALDQAQIRRWKRKALHLHLDLRRPVWQAASMGPTATALRQQTLMEIVTERLSARPGIDADVLRARALDYLAQATEQDAPRQSSEVAA